MTSAANSLTSTFGRRVAIVGALGVVIGGLTSVGQGVLPFVLSPLANSAGSWCVAAFVLALTERSPRRAALLAALALLSMLAGYAVVTVAAGAVVGTRLLVFWGAAAVVAGPVLGIGAAWTRGSDALRAGVGVSPIAGILLGEGIYGLTVVAESTPPAYWLGQIIVGLVVLIASAARLRSGPAILAMLAATSAVTAAFYVVYSGNLLILLP